MARQRRRFDIFSMSFLDTICCAFGALVLLYMVLNAASGKETDRRTASARADASKLEVEVLEGYQNLVVLTNALRSATNQEVTAQGLSARVLEEITTSKEQLAEYNETTLSRREHINQLKADLKSLEEGNRRLEAGSRSSGAPGNKVLGFRGTGDRQYLTGLRLKGRNTLILLDASASMLDETIVNVIRLRNMDAANRKAARKWRSAIATVEWVMSQLVGQSQFQLYAFNTKAWPLVSGSDGKWLSTSDSEALSKAVTGTRELVPQNGTSLENAFAVVSALSPRPDNVIILTDGLPTQDSGGPGLRKTINADGRMRLFDRAIGRYPSKVPLNIILFPMEGDPYAAGAFWQAAQRTNGSFLVPAKDWP